MAWGILFMIVLLCAYFLPTIIGAKKKNANAIFVLNLFLGWTFIGWVVALVWSCTYEEKSNKSKAAVSAKEDVD